MKTSCHVTSQWIGVGITASPWRPKFVDDHPNARGFVYVMLTAGDPRSDPPVPVDLLAKCDSDAAWLELLSDATYTPTDVVQYSNEDGSEGDPLW
jgi:hypothetical protein